MTKKKAPGPAATALLLFVLLLLFFAGVWQLFGRARLVKEEWIAGPDGTFAAKSPAVTAIGIYDDTVPYNLERPEQELQANLVITDPEGNVLWESGEKVFPELFSLEGTSFVPEEPIELGSGGSCRIAALSPEGEEIRGRTFLLYGGEKSMPLHFAAFALAFSLAAVFLYLCAVKVLQLPFGVFFAVWMLIFAVLGTLAAPPLTVPDELMHLSSTIRMRNLILEKLPVLGNPAMIRSGLTRMSNFGGRQFASVFFTHSAYGNDVAELGAQYFFVGPMPHYCYFVPAVGMLAGEILHLPYQGILLLARLANYGLYVGAALVSMRLVPQWKRGIAAFSFLPSTVLLMHSLSYDIWNMAFCLLTFCFFLYLGEKESVPIPEILLGLVLLVVMIPVKFVYVVFGLALFLIPLAKVKLKHKKAALIGLVLAFAAVAVVLVISRGEEAYQFLFGYGYDERAQTDVSTTYHLGYVLQNPVRTALVFVKTFVHQISVWVQTAVMGENYLNGIPVVLRVLPAYLFVRLCLRGEKGSRRERLISLVILLLGCFTVMFSFLFLYSAIPASGIGMIEGLQGRYYLPYLVTLPVILGSAVRRGKEEDEGTNAPAEEDGGQDRILYELAAVSLVIHLIRMMTL